MQVSQYGLHDDHTSCVFIVLASLFYVLAKQDSICYPIEKVTILFYRKVSNMSEKQKFYISDLSYSNHIFHTYHFCRGNGNRRKSRFGLIEKGSGTYMYLNKKLFKGDKNEY